MNFNFNLGYDIKYTETSSKEKVKNNHHKEKWMAFSCNKFLLKIQNMKK